MYNKALDVFIAVADTGSFTKAAERLFISSTAVMKQINNLESELDLKLFNRLHSGVRLTLAGSEIYKNAKKIIEFSNNSIKCAKEISLKERKTLKIGTSTLNPCQNFLNDYFDILKDYKISIVNFMDTTYEILNVISSLGTSFDLLVGVCDSKEWLKRINFYELGEVGFSVTMDKKNSLASKKKIKFKELKNYNVFNVKRGDSPINDNMRDNFIAINNKDFKDAPHFYDIDTFNNIVGTNDVLLVPSCWNYIHPLLTTIPLDEDYKLPYGIIYSKSNNEIVLNLIDKIKTNNK